MVAQISIHYTPSWKKKRKRKNYPLLLAVANRRDLSLFFTSIWLNFPCQVALFIKILSAESVCKKKIKSRGEKKWYFVIKIVLTYCEKKIVLVIEKKLLKFEAEGQEFAKFLRSLEH